MADGSTPALAGSVDTADIMELATSALLEIDHCDSLISVSARALRDQGCDMDAAVADVIEESAWARLDAARKAIDGIRQKCGLRAQEVDRG